MIRDGDERPTGVGDDHVAVARLAAGRATKSPAWWPPPDCGVDSWCTRDSWVAVADGAATLSKSEVTKWKSHTKYHSSRGNERLFRPAIQQARCTITIPYVSYGLARSRASRW
jgi:hypothetical protein